MGPEQPKNGRGAGSFLANLILVFGEKSESGRQQMIVVFVAHVLYAWLVGRGRDRNMLNKKNELCTPKLNLSNLI